MVGPYRSAPGVEFSDGVCPWCSAEIRFDAAVTSAVCEHCGARYAPALIRPRPSPAIDPPPGRGERAALWMLRAGLLGGAAVAVSLGVMFAVIGAITIIVGTRGRVFLLFVGNKRDQRKSLPSNTASSSAPSPDPDLAKPRD